MRQPAPPDAIEQLREYLQFAVPLRSITLIADNTPEDLARYLPGMAMRAGKALGGRGDALTFAGSKPAATIRTADDLATGIAALAMLAGADGVTVFGAHFCPQQPCPHAGAEL